MSKKSEIRFVITLDEEKNPIALEWGADDADFEGLRPCDGLLLSLWDPEEKNTLGLDLWTSKMLVHHMSVHFFQTLMRLAETYQRATGQRAAAEKLRQCAVEFARAAQIPGPGAS